jgi:serine/alanine racemase
MENIDRKSVQHNEMAAIDVMKFIMAILVVGIHTEPFGFNTWLDRGFGIITRLCVPFFFVAGSYFFFQGNKSLWKYLSRIAELYIIWSIIYLPFDISGLKQMSISEILVRYLWSGNDHALWYLCGTISGTLVVYLLQIVFSDLGTIFITTVFLIIGCMGSTWAPLVENMMGHYITITDLLGYRNGLFYGAVYIALGMYLARNKHRIENRRKVNLFIGFAISMFLLVVESVLCVLLFNTPETILWISVLPASYFLFRLLVEVKINISVNTSRFLRQLSTLIYLSHGLFLILLKERTRYVIFFAGVALLSVAFGTLVIKASNKIVILKKIY